VSDFELHIQLGNEAMRTPQDVAAKLRSVADNVESGREDGAILDLNGNTVGRFTARYPEDTADADD
jgi:hypothetical protein